VEVHKKETEEIIRRFLKHQRSFPHCVTALERPLLPACSQN